MSIRGWNNAYGLEPTNAQITIHMNLLKCSDQQLWFKDPLVNIVETYTFKSELQDYLFGWDDVQSDVISQCQPNRQIEILFGQSKSNINMDAKISSVFALSITDPANLVFSINTDHNMDSLMSYNNDTELPIKIPFHVRAFDSLGRI